MDRKLILSVAGSGKTRLLIDKLDLERRFLVVTYTTTNRDNINRRILKRFGYHPKNIVVYTYFEFLMAVCYRPFLADKVKAKGISWNTPDPKTLRYKRDNLAFYLNSRHCLYSNRIARLCENHADDIASRIAKYYDCFYYDEAQDLDGHDFNLIRKIIPDCIETLIVGDFFQHTYSTSNDGNTNKGLYNDLIKYKRLWIEAGYEIDETTRLHSHRCSASICRYVRDTIGIDIYPEKNNLSEICRIDSHEDADTIICNNLIPKLFYQDAHKYGCYSLNWGESKGLDDFDDVAIVLNKTTLQAFDAGVLHTLALSTRNKFYVACTRARCNIYFIPFQFLEKYKRG